MASTSALGVPLSSRVFESAQAYSKPFFSTLWPAMVTLSLGWTAKLNETSALVDFLAGQVLM